MTGLLQACIRGDLGLVKKHLDGGADVNYTPYKLTCLNYAVAFKHEEVVSLLLQHPGIDVNAQDRTGRTAFHWAAGEDGTPAMLRLLLDFPGIDKEAEIDGRTPLMLTIDCGTPAQFAEFIKTPDFQLNGTRLKNLLIQKPELQKMVVEEQLKRENKRGDERRRLEKVKREEKKAKREIFNETEKWKEMKLARRRQKEAVEELIRKNKEAEEEMSREGKVRQEKVEKEFQDKIEALAKEIKLVEDEKKKRVIQINLEEDERQKALSEANQDKLNNLTKKHKAENADMVEHILDNEDEEAAEAGEDAEDEEAEDQGPVAPDCPICYEEMSPPMRILQCGAGHLLCGTCRPRLKECPSRCGQPMLGPAIGLEHFVGKLRTPKDDA